MHYSSIFIEGLLNYYKNQSLFEVILVDSTEDSLEFEIPDYIHYLKVPNDTAFSKKMHKALCKVRTKYVVWNADDDFYNFEAIISGISFLEDNKNYSSFYGQTILYDGNFSIYTTKSNSITHPNSTERVKYGFKYYDNRLNSVMKSDDLRGFFRLYSSDFATPSYTFEFANAFHFLKKGKVKYSSIPFIFRRQVENSAANIEFNDLKFWNEDKYLNNKSRFVELLASKERISEELVVECLSIIYGKRRLPFLLKYAINQILLKIGFFKVKTHEAYKILSKEGKELKHQ